MAFPTKASMPISSYRSSDHDLSCQHVTTNDFMQFSVAKCLELVPKQSISVEHALFSRLEPMPVPTFGRGSIKNRAYFVPYRTIFPAWNDFITDTPHIYDGGNIAVPVQVPFINIQSFVSLFINYPDYIVNKDSVPDTEKVDIVYTAVTGSSTTVRKRNLTNLGRFAYKLLRSLGYAWTFTSLETGRVSALPLLAAARVYMDFYYPSAYSSDEESAWVQQFFVNNEYSSAGTPILTTDDLVRLFKVLYRVCYDSDYFTAAWDNPAGPNDGLSSNFSIIDPTNISNTGNDESPLSVANNPDNGTGYDTPEIIQAAGTTSISRITQFALNALRGLSDYMKRHQLAGSRAIDRYLSRFGIKLAAEKLNRSIFIRENVQDLQFGDVTSSSYTDSAKLGAYAGKGLSFGNNHYQFSADEYGMFIVTSVIVPDTQYYEGLNRHVRHMMKTDFYTPEFDNLGAQAIDVREVYCPADGREYPGSSPAFSRIFGFVPRYAEYKTPFSQITGDYILPTLSEGKDSWTLFRSVKPLVESVGGLANFSHSYEFVMGLDADQFNRIFYNTDSNTDHFNIIHDFNIKSNFPGKSLYDTYDFENEDSAQKVTVDVGGTTHS